MSDDDDGAEADGHVIFSFLVNSSKPIPSLQGMDGRKCPTRPDDDHLYDVYENIFDEPDGSARASRVDTSIHEAVDKLVATGIDLNYLQGEDVTVRAYFTFPVGPETIRAEALQRLASCHATIWIDANG